MHNHILQVNRYNAMGSIRIDDKRWQKLTDKELKLSMKAGKIVKKSQIINYIIDNELNNIDYVNGEVVLQRKNK